MPRGKFQRRSSALGASLDLAEPEGYVRTFLDLEQPMVQLLALAVQNGIHPEYTRHLLSTFPAATAPGVIVTEVQKRNLALLKPLSGREIEYFS